MFGENLNLRPINPGRKYERQGRRRPRNERGRQGQELNNRICCRNVELETTAQTFMLRARPSPLCDLVSVTIRDIQLRDSVSFRMQSGDKNCHVATDRPVSHERCVTQHCASCKLGYAKVHCSRTFRKATQNTWVKIAANLTCRSWHTSDTAAL